MESPEPNDASAPVTSSGSIDFQTLVKKLGPAAILGVIAIACPLLGSTILLAKADTVGHWLRDHETQGVVTYAAGFIVLTGLALLPTYASAMLGGWAFGFQTGSIASIIGFTGAATLGYVIGRIGSRDRVQKVIAEHPKWKAISDALLGGGFWKTLGIVTMVRLPPNSPFAISNLVLAGVKTNPVAYVVGTAVGMAPRTFAYVYIASGLANQLSAKDVADAKTPTWMFVAGIAAFVVVLVVLTYISKRALAHLTSVPKAS